MKKSEEEFTYLPLSEASKPKQGWGARVIENQWWLYHPQKGLVFWLNRMPQCNSSKATMERIARTRPDIFQLKFMKIVYYWKP